MVKIYCPRITLIYLWSLRAAGIALRLAAGLREISKTGGKNNTFVHCFYVAYIRSLFFPPSMFFANPANSKQVKCQKLRLS